MKLPSITPWLVIRWSFVGLLFAGTVAVAVDQLKSRQTQIEKLAQKLELAQEANSQSALEKKRMTATCTDLKSENQRLKDYIAQLHTAVDEAQTANGKHVKALEDLVSGLESATVPTSRPPVASPQAYLPQPVIPVIPEPQTPAWIPPPSWQIAKLIKGRALAKWKDDFSMVEHEVTQQTTALNTLIQYNKYAANRPLLARAAIEWPDDYHMMQYEFEKQVEALKKLSGR